MEEVESPQPLRKIVRSAIVVKGRGEQRVEKELEDGVRRYDGIDAEMEEVGDHEGGVAKSLEGWTVFVRGIHEEAQQEDVRDVFAEFGDIRNLNLVLARRTGLVKGYALLQYKEKREAQAAVDGMDGQELFGQRVSVAFAFKYGRPARRPLRRRRDDDESFRKRIRVEDGE